MKTPRSRLRSTAYHMVDASLGPWIACHGRSGAIVVVRQARLASCPRVATRPS